MKRKLLFLFGSMAAMMLSASPVVDRVDFSKKLPAGSAMSAKVDNLEKVNLSSKKLIRAGKVNSFREQFSSNPWYAEGGLIYPYYFSFGCFKSGVDADFYSLIDYYVLQPSNVEVEWRNLASAFGFNMFEWTYVDPKTDSIKTSLNSSLIDVYPYTTLPMPSLTVSLDGEYEDKYPPQDGERSYYANYGGGLTFQGEDESEPSTYGACNYDLDKGLSFSGLGNNDSDNSRWADQGITINGIINLFDEPAAPYILDGLWLNAYNVSASQDATLTMTIYKFNSDAFYLSELKGDVIATSTIGIDNIEDIGDGFFNVNFPIMTVDEDGFETEGSILISDAILVEITGYNAPEFESFEPLVQAENNVLAQNYMYINVTFDGEPESTVVGFEDTYTAWMVNLSASFPFLATQEDEYTADEEGGEFIVSVAIPSYLMSKSPARVISSTETTSGVTIKEMPEWVSYVSDSYNETTGMYDFVMNAEAIPDEMEGRQDEIVFGYNYMEMTVPVNQGQPLSVEDAYAKAITSAFILDDLQLTYPSDVKKLSIYSATGTLVKIVDLDEGGSDVVSMPMAKGVYMLSFEGKDRVVRKVIK